MTRRERRVDWTREYLVRYGNLLDARRDWAPSLYKYLGVTPRALDTEIRKLRQKLLRTPTDILLEAANELNRREESYGRGSYETTR